MPSIHKGGASMLAYKALKEPVTPLDDEGAAPISVRTIVKNFRCYRELSMEPGSPAPDFTLPTDKDIDFCLSDQKGQIVVVYFYPKDATPGCTKQAIAFRDHQAAFDKAGAVILGISKDSVKKHQNFVSKQELSFPLASDEHSDVCEAYGVWKEKIMYGKTYMGIERSTFVIDMDGKIAHAWRGVKVPGHVEDVLAVVQTLAAD